MKLTADEMSVVRTRYEIAERFRNRLVKKDYERAYGRYKNVHYGSDYTKAKSEPVLRTPMTVSYDWPIFETKLHSIGFTYPDFTVEPMTDAAEAFADVSRVALEHEWRACEVQDEVRAALLDRMVAGIGICLVTWQFETEAMDAGEIDAPDAYLVEGGRLPVAGDESSQGDEANDQAVPPVPKEKVIKDAPLVLRIDPLAFFVDPECGNKLNRAAYCGFVEYRPLQEVKRDPRFRNTKNLKGSADSLQGYLTRPESVEGEPDYPSDVKRVKLCHYYEKLRKVHVIFAPDEHEKALLVEKWTYDFGGYPFSVIAAGRLGNDWWAAPECLYWEHSVKEIEQAAATQAANTRAGIVKVVVQGDPATPNQQSQMRSAHPYAIIQATDRQRILPLPLPQQMPELEAVFNRAEAQIQFISGLSAYQMSAPPTKRTPGVEVAQIAQAGGARALHDRQAFEEFCSDVLRKMLSLLMQYNTVARNLPVYDNETEAVVGWRKFDPRAISRILAEHYPDLDTLRHFSVVVHVGSTTAPNSADTLENISYFLQALLPVAQAYPVLQQIGIDLKPIILAAARSIPGIRNIGQIISPLVGQMQNDLSQNAADPGNGYRAEDLSAFLEVLSGHPAVTPEQMKLLQLLQLVNQLPAPGPPGALPPPAAAGAPPFQPPGLPPAPPAAPAPPPV